MTRAPASAARTLAALGVLTAFAALLRIPFLGIGVWRDEAYSYFDITQSSLSGMLENVVRVETNPPLFFLLERGFGSIFGFSETSLKIVPLICGVLLVPATFWLASALLRPRAAWLAAWLIATTQVALYYSQELRPYTLTALLVVAMLGAYVRWLASAGRPWWVAWALLLEYTHYAGAIAIVATVIATCLLPARERPSARAPALGVAILVAGFLPWLPFLAQQLRAGTPWLAPVPWFARPGMAVAAMAYALPGFFRGPVLTLLLGYVAFVVLAVYALLLYARMRRRSERLEREAGAFVVALTVLGVVVAEALLGYRDVRYVFPVLALAIVAYAGLLDEAAAALIARLNGPPAAAALLLGYVGLLFAATDVEPSLLGSRQPKTGMRAAGEELATPQMRGAAILVAPDFAAASAAYYAPGRRVFGFPRWNDSQRFDIAADAAAWAAPDSVARTLAQVDRLAASGTPLLALVRPTRLSAPFRQAGSLPYQRADELGEELGRRYRVVESVDFPANTEWSSMIVYDLTARNR